MGRYFKFIYLLLTLIFGAIYTTEKIVAEEPSVNSILITDTKTFISPLTGFHTSQIVIPWQSGKVVLAGNPEGTATADVGIDLQISAGSSILFTYRGKCTGSSATEIPLEPLDITHLMSAPSKTLKFDFRKPGSTCTPSQITIGPLYLVHFNDSQIRPRAFLDLPWDYTKKIDGSSSGFTYEQAALSMDTFFDHDVPLRRELDKGESDTQKNGFVNFAGIGVTSSYSGYDGYGWGARAGISEGREVLASAEGKARIETSDFCGAMVTIDHVVSSVDNSRTFNFQTRYCQINPDSSIPEKTSGNFKTVSLGEKIGTVSGTAKITAKPQLYFVVIWDKNNDGLFEDNLINGLVDPFGWQATFNDPWASFSSSEMGYTGNKSYYLFNTGLGDTKVNYKASVDNVFSVGSIPFKFFRNLYKDQFSIDRDAFLTFTHTPRNSFFNLNSTSQTLQSASTVLQIEMRDEFGVDIETFAGGSNKFFTLNIPFDSALAQNFAPGTLGLYYSKDGSNWTKEDASRYTITGNTVSGTINHLTQFAVMGEPTDSLAPVTTLKINDNEPQTSYSESVNLTFETDSTGSTMYKITGQGFQKYETMVTLTDPGNYTVEYFSEDEAYNVENLKTFSFEIISPTQAPTQTPTPTPTTIPSNNQTTDTALTPTPTIIGFSKEISTKYSTQKVADDESIFTKLYSDKKQKTNTAPIMGAVDDSPRKFSLLIYILTVAGVLLFIYYLRTYLKKKKKLLM